jgi:carboxypeptidase C (cathepsin A)
VKIRRPDFSILVRFLCCLSFTIQSASNAAFAKVSDSGLKHSRADRFQKRVKPVGKLVTAATDGSGLDDDESEPSTSRSGKKSDKKSKGNSDGGEDKDKDADEPKLSVTEHTVVIDGVSVRYKATAGFMLLKDFAFKKNRHEDSKSSGDKSDKEKDKDKKPKSLAKMFFIAYTKVGGGQKRPISFAFNGGPGSSSVWLHMGGLGPRRPVLTDRGEALPPPFRLEDNSHSWLDETDLVFIDPVSTGYSRPEPDQDPKSFHGYKEDIESVGEFIRLYTTKNKRWTSPKFIVGESYGTTRAAGLSSFLQERYGMYLNGIVLVSAVLNFGTLDFAPGNDLPYALFMPGYTAAAWYHKKLSPELQAKSLKEVLNDAENFVETTYLPALFQGDRLNSARRQEISQNVATAIGLPSKYVSQLNGRVPDSLFFTHLLSDENRVIGRYDARFTGVRVNPGRDHEEYDPSAEAVNGAFTATLNDYVRRELKFESELPYEILANVWPWSFKSYENRYLNVSEDLRKAMICNPYLKVWFCCGYYDLATPYYGARYTVDQMNLDPSISKNIQLTYYEAGHMMYIYKPAMLKLKTDMRSFLKNSILPDSNAIPSASP